MTISRSTLEMVKFNGTGNFKLWQTRVKDLLAIDGTLKALQAQKPASMDDEDWEELQQRATGTIRFCLADEIMHHVMNLESPIEVWNKLENEFLPKSVQNKLYLKLRLHSLEMQEGTDLALHVNVFNQIIADLMQFGVNFDDEDKSIMLLRSLPRRYEQGLNDIGYGEKTIKFEEIILALFAQNQVRQEKDGSGTEKIMSKSNEEKMLHCYKCREPGHKKRECTKNLKE